MNITFFSSMEGSSWGGSEDLWYGTALLALEKGINVQVCVKEWDNLSDKIKNLQRNGAQIVFREKPPKITFRKIINRLAYQKTNLGYLTNFRIGYPGKIKSFKPDAMLISQGATFDFFFISYLYHYIQRTKTPYSLISQWNVENGGILNTGTINRIKNTFNWSNFYFVAERNLLTAERQYGGTLHNSKVVSNLSDFSGLEPGNWPAETGYLKLACIGRLDCRTKGQDILFEALSSEQFKNIKFEINLYGSGDDHEHLKALVAYYGLSDKIFFKGHIHDRNEIWANNHMLILPSISEGTSLALQECMLKGRPALATDVGDSAKLVIDNKTGFLASVCSVNALQKSLTQLFNTPIDDLKVMGNNASIHANAIVIRNSSELILNDLIASASLAKK